MFHTEQGRVVGIINKMNKKALTQSLFKTLKCLLEVLPVVEHRLTTNALVQAQWSHECYDLNHRRTGNFLPGGGGGGGR